MELPCSSIYNSTVVLASSIFYTLKISSSAAQGFHSPSSQSHSAMHATRGTPAYIPSPTTIYLIMHSGSIAGTPSTFLQYCLGSTTRSYVTTVNHSRTGPRSPDIVGIEAQCNNQLAIQQPACYITFIHRLYFLLY